MKNVTELRSELSNVFGNLKNKEIDPKRAKVMVDSTNAMLKSAQLEMEYTKLTGSIKPIKFLETE